MTAHPLTTTVGSIVTASMMSHGRSDFRRGEAYKPHAAASWQEGWRAEANLAARALQRPEISDAIGKLDALDALELAKLVLDQCTVSKPTRSQSTIMAQAKPVIEAALARMQAACIPDGEDSHTEQRNPG
jgi:hypothetical protein